eukprot:1790075-Rhodomonas_salina.2
MKPSLSLARSLSLPPYQSRSVSLHAVSLHAVCLFTRLSSPARLAQGTHSQPQRAPSLLNPFAASVPVGA